MVFNTVEQTFNTMQRNNSGVCSVRQCSMRALLESALQELLRVTEKSITTKLKKIKSYITRKVSLDKILSQVFPQGKAENIDLHIDT